GPPKTGSAARSAGRRGLARAAAMIAESGSSRPGATSRSAAYRSRAYQSDRTAASWRLLRSRCMPDVRRPGSPGGAGAGAGGFGLEFWLRPPGLARARELGGERLTQRGEQLDVERGVHEPVVRQRAGAPICGGVALLQPHAEVLLDHRAERHAVVAKQPARE